MGYPDIKFSSPVFVETIYNAPAENAFISFNVDKWMFPHPISTRYIVSLPTQPAADRLEHVVTLSRGVTLQLGCPDDLDVIPNVNSIPVDPVLYKFTHALEHLSVAHLAITNKSVLTKLSDSAGGKTSVFRVFGSNRFLVNFCFTPGLPPTERHELASIQSACSAISQLKIE